MEASHQAHPDGHSTRGSIGSGQSIDAISPIEEQKNPLLRTDESSGREHSAPQTKVPNAAIESLSHASKEDEKEISKSISSSSQLQRFPFIVFLTLGYVALAIFAWVMTCKLVYRPVTTEYYGLWLRDKDVTGAFYPQASMYANNERWLQAIRVVQTIVAVSTIPLTSAVCSSAAVLFMQRKCNDTTFSLRQAAVLADKGWTEFEIYGHLLRGRWIQYGSRLLYAAIFLNLLGALTSPLQSIFTSTRSIQTPSSLAQVQKLTDLIDRPDNYDPTNDEIAAASLRAILTSTSSTDPQVRLWSAAGATNCTDVKSASSNACSFGQASLRNLSVIDDPFVAQLPAGYSTGLVRQFLPRINSSATRERIADEDFPVNCNSSRTSFFANYSTTVNYGWDQGKEVAISWHLVACMPGNQTQSPWNRTRLRHDFSEQLFLNVSAFNPSPSESTPAEAWSGLFKITLDTTTGFFELPNYMNGQRPGPLLSDDPSSHCGRDCIMQGGIGSSGIYDHNNTYPTHVRRDTVESNGTTTTSDSAFDLMSIKNKGPLLTVALSLFGPESFIANRVAHPETYVDRNRTTLSDKCIDRAPFMGLLTTMGAKYDLRSTQNFIQCISNNQWNFGQLQEDMVDYVQTFIGLPSKYSSIYKGPPYDELLVNAFEAAAFLANEQWLTSADQPTLTVSYDQGTATQVPYISRAAIILISTILGVYLTSLLLMASYSVWSPRWTGRLDSLAMMQLGAAIAEHLPLDLVTNSRHVKILDETPGWIGDGSNGRTNAGELGLGAIAPLQAKKKYRCFEHDRSATAPP